MQHSDALVIGGGPAGATAAILLARAGWSVILLERKSFPRRKVCGEYLSATNWPLLDHLGVAEAFAELAGPPIREVALFAGSRVVRADLPCTSRGAWRWGRALRREHLDLLLLRRAVECGVDVLQPARCMGLEHMDEGFRCRVTNNDLSRSSPGATETALHARVVIAAHGSWDIGPLPTQRQTAAPGATEWIAFKAHFTDTGLPAGWMPLLSFPDGYGGMVHCDGGRTTLSCCIRRNRLTRLERAAGEPAGDAVCRFILDCCPAVRSVLAAARRDGLWMSAGSIQPGIRPRCRDGVFVVGNAAGEAHPVVAEGISMAMQSAWLLVQRLTAARAGLSAVHHRATIERVGREYSRSWYRSFAPRIRAAAAVAQWASRPALAKGTLPVVRAFPSLLTLGARLSGKSTQVIPVAALSP
jgi:menaquinone-9 beta-reductase